MRSGDESGLPGVRPGHARGPGDKLDEMLKDVYGGTREDFLNGTGEWVASHYGRLQ